jgi:hypothetical protein
MGFIVLDKQLQAIKRLTENTNGELIELLWLSGGIQLTTWKSGQPQTVIINDDGEALDG